MLDILGLLDGIKVGQRDDDGEALGLLAGSMVGQRSKTNALPLFVACESLPLDPETNKSLDKDRPQPKPSPSPGL